MLDLNLERKKLELKRVDVARLEMEFKILERLEDINRLKENIVIQENRIEQLNAEINTTKE